LLDGVPPKGNYDLLHALYRFPKIIAKRAMRMDTPLRT
jgi:hypothetical protein